MGFVKFLLAMLLAGSLIVAVAALVVLIPVLWVMGDWWWALVLLGILCAWYWKVMAFRGEKRNDFGV